MSVVICQMAEIDRISWNMCTVCHLVNQTQYMHLGVVVSEESPGEDGSEERVVTQVDHLHHHLQGQHFVL
jgi:hypothetical protein